MDCRDKKDFFITDDVHMIDTTLDSLNVFQCQLVQQLHLIKLYCWNSEM
jgi:hypothetical protein